jgi:signal transduction histidine kinase
MSATWDGIRNCLLESQETERQRLAQALHDGALQELHSLDFGLVGLSPFLTDEQAQRQWATVRMTLHSISRQLRTLCQELRPPALGPFGLSAVLHSTAENFHRQHPEIAVDLELMHDGTLLSQVVRLTFYRICQHALRNVAQHASAHHVRITLQLNGKVVKMGVEDDGKGFAVPSSFLDWANEGRLGLFEAKQRAESINGKLEINCVSGAGVCLWVTAPLAPATDGT